MNPHPLKADGIFAKTLAQIWGIALYKGWHGINAKPSLTERPPHQNRFYSTALFNTPNTSTIAKVSSLQYSKRAFLVFSCSSLDI